MWQAWAIFGLIVWFVPDLQNFTGLDFRYNYDHQPSKLFDNFTGALLANRYLSNAEKLFVGEFRGPECFAQFNGKIYTSIGDGRIIELLKDSYRTAVHLSPNGLSVEECKEMRNTGKCSRPIGMKFDSAGALYVVDPYNGLYRVNVDSGESELVLNITKIKVTDGSTAQFLDDLEIIERGPGRKHLFYLTDASQKWLLHDAGNVVSEADNTGRLLRFDLETEKLDIALSNLYFPNGLQLTDDKKSLIICMLTERNLAKYNLKTGELTHFTELPGEPDNIKRSKNANEETYWVALFTARNKYNPSPLMDRFGNFGGLKRFGFRMTRMIGKLMIEFGTFLNIKQLQNIGFYTKIGGPLFDDGCNYGMVVEVNSAGEIINSLHSPDGSICQLSEAFEYENNEKERKFYLGSFSNSYLGSLTLPKSSFREESQVLRNSEQNSRKVPKSTQKPKSSSSQTSSQQPQQQSKQSNTKQTQTVKQASANQQNGKRHQEL